MKNIPKIARKTYTPKAFHKRLIKKLSLPQDRDFLAGMFSEDEKGRMRLKGDPSPKELKRLKKLGKAIKKNRGMLRIGRLIIPALLLAGVLVFNLVWKDRLLTTAMESGLEYIFQAESEVDGLELQLFSGTVTIGRVTAANADKPMQNLFQAEDLLLEIDMPSLLARKLVIHDMRIGSLAYGTERSESGALPAEGAIITQDTNEQSDGTSGDVDSLRFADMELLSPDIPSLDADDARKMVLEYRDSLQVIQSIDTAVEQGQATVEEWQARIGNYRNQLSSLESLADDAAAIDPRELTSPTAIVEARDTVRAAVSQTSQLQSSLGDPIRELQSDIAGTRQLLATAGSGLEADLAALREQVSGIAANPGDLLLGAAVSLLSDSALGRLEDVRSGYVRLQRLQGLYSPASESAPRSPLDRGGEMIPLATMEYPGLYLGQAGADFELQEAAHSMRLQKLSSDPSVVGEATGFDYLLSRPDTRLQLEGSLPLHDPSLPPLSLAVNYEGFAVDITRTIDGIGEISLQGTADLAWDTSLSGWDALTTGARLQITDPEIAVSGGSELINSLIEDTVHTAGRIDLDISATAADGRIHDLTGRTNLDALFAEGLSSIVEQKRVELEAALERELRSLLERERERLAPVEEQIEALRSQANSLEQRLRGEQDRVEEIRERITAEIGSLDQTRAEIEARLNQEAAELEAEARRRAEAARQEAEAEIRRRAQEEREAAEAEARQRAEEEREAAEEEARQRIQDEARDRLPGF